MLIVTVNKLLPESCVSFYEAFVYMLFLGY